MKKFLLYLFLLFSFTAIAQIKTDTIVFFYNKSAYDSLAKVHVKRLLEVSKKYEKIYKNIVIDLLWSVNHEAAMHLCKR